MTCCPFKALYPSLRFGMTKQFREKHSVARPLFVTLSSVWRRFETPFEPPSLKRQSRELFVEKSISNIIQRVGDPKYDYLSITHFSHIILFHVSGLRPFANLGLTIFLQIVRVSDPKNDCLNSTQSNVL